MSWLLIVGIICLIANTAFGQEELTCQGQELNMTAEQKQVITDCLAENKIPSIWKIPIEKLACIGVCILEKKNLLNSEGGLDHDKIYKYIMEVMKPDSVKKPLVDGMEKCMKDFGSKVKEADDPTCSAYNEVGACVHDIFLEICLKE